MELGLPVALWETRRPVTLGAWVVPPNNFIEQTGASELDAEGAAWTATFPICLNIRMFRILKFQRLWTSQLYFSVVSKAEYEVIRRLDGKS